MAGSVKNTGNRENIEAIKERRRARQRKRKKALIIRVMVPLVLVVILVVSIFLALKYTPTKERMALTDYYKLSDKEIATIVDGVYEETDEENINALNEGGNIYLELEFLKNQFDDGYVYDYSEKIMRYTTDSEVYTVNINSSDYMVDRTQKSIGHSVLIEDGGSVYVAIDFVEELTDINHTFVQEPDRVYITRAGYSKKTATVKKSTQVRRMAGVKSPILEDIEAGEKVEVLEELGDWKKVITSNNVIGCVKKKRLSDITEETVEKRLEERKYNHILLDKKITMAWQQMTSRSGNDKVKDVIASTQGLDVISPTWFVICSESGDIQSLASQDYVDYCHSKGIQVWPTVNNIELYDVVDTTKVLNTTSSRDSLVNNLITAAISYDLDGINVDFERVQKDAKDGYIQFIRELSIKCEKNDIILSIDNYVPTEYTAHYNRAEQSKYADYIVIMGYDEHYVGGDEAGSTASKDFVRDGIEDTLKYVPENQIILGMPFYCRLWRTEKDGTLSSTAYGIVGAQKLIKNKGVIPKPDSQTGQDYAEYMEGDDKYQIWLENSSSLEWKLKFVNEYHIAGGSFWKLGFEDTETWNLIARYLN